MPPRTPLTANDEELDPVPIPREEDETHPTLFRLDRRIGVCIAGISDVAAAQVRVENAVARNEATALLRHEASIARFDKIEHHMGLRRTMSGSLIATKPPSPPIEVPFTSSSGTGSNWQIEKEKAEKILDEIREVQTEERLAKEALAAARAQLAEERLAAEKAAEKAAEAAEKAEDQRLAREKDARERAAESRKKLMAAVTIIVALAGLVGWLLKNFRYVDAERPAPTFVAPSTPHGTAP